MMKSKNILFLTLILSLTLQTIGQELSCRLTDFTSPSRQFTAATSLFPNAFFAGGTLSNNYPSDIIVVLNYNDLTRSYSRISEPRNYLAATSVSETHALFAGGETESGGYSSVVDIFYGSSKSWSTSQLSVARAGLAATSVGDFALFAGGISADGVVVDTVDIYDSSLNSWTTAKLSVARTNLAATSVGIYAIFAGGSKQPNPGVYSSNTVDIFDSTSKTWSTSKISFARENLVGTSLGNLAFFGGGNIAASTMYGYLDTVDIYDSTSHTWSTTRLSVARTFLTAVTFGGRALFVGGYDGSDSKVIDSFSANSRRTYSLTGMMGRGISGTAFNNVGVFSNVASASDFGEWLNDTSTNETNTDTVTNGTNTDDIIFYHRGSFCRFYYTTLGNEEVPDDESPEDYTTLYPGEGPSDSSASLQLGVPFGSVVVEFMFVFGLIVCFKSIF